MTDFVKMRELIKQEDCVTFKSAVSESVSGVTYL